MFNSPYLNAYNPQASIDKLNEQINNLERMKSQIQQTPMQQPTNLTQNFQLAESSCVHKLGKWHILRLLTHAPILYSLLFLIGTVVHSADCFLETMNDLHKIAQVNHKPGTARFCSRHL